ncbi:uncharacterized protein SETTUDRAFT_168911 [Exserohilum turcica Et28A]|uniref:Uncharacterized protein n=1 Tax=Exserohilum turcicum (strain 28A) TaxID=671987 RepID=R0IT09_EXST2|nr:uncharacterized protein SETTUDRAFT_168911 [Exserohilum turcica Et28A]EOA87786.1 hypothetical protein SETTUDRAFT_168911 [Exserohilum turcica Et28A]
MASRRGTYQALRRTMSKPVSKPTLVSRRCDDPNKSALSMHSSARSNCGAWCKED